MVLEDHKPGLVLLSYKGIHDVRKKFTILKALIRSVLLALRQRDVVVLTKREENQLLVFERKVSYVGS
jgi:hypothetical protein